MHFIQAGSPFPVRTLCLPHANSAWKGTPSNQIKDKNPHLF